MANKSRNIATLLAVQGALPDARQFANDSPQRAAAVRFHEARLEALRRGYAKHPIRISAAALRIMDRAS